MGQTLSRVMGKFTSTPEDLSLLRAVVGTVSLARSLPFTVNLWKAQNLYFEVPGKSYPEFQEKAKQGDPAAQEWLRHFTSLAEQLSIRAPYKQP